MDDIRREVYEDLESIDVVEDWLTPAGNQRSVPMFEADVGNSFLGKSRLIKGKDRADVMSRAREQLEKWAEEEIKLRTHEAVEARDDLAKEQMRALETILVATLDIHDRLDWEAMLDKRAFMAFSFAPQPSPDAFEPKPWYAFLLPFLARRWEARNGEITAQNQRALDAWSTSRASSLAAYERKHAEHEAARRAHNEQVTQARTQYESGNPGSIEEYIAAVFERSHYPDGFFVEHAVAFEPQSKTAVVDLELPPQDSVPDTIGFKFAKARGELVPIELKPKQHDALYDSAVKQCVLRTFHEVFESEYAGHVQACVVNGFVTAVDRATGKEKRTCIISVSAQRSAFDGFDLSRIDPGECIKGLKGLVAGPLSEMAPVRPLLQLSRQDARFVDARDVLDELGDQNLAAMKWEDFEHLVRELCSKMFAAEGAEVKVTQASRDQGVDAIAFDPDPIRGGKFVIQAKRYTKVVPVAAVRDLYGTVINEGATRGILVTTAHYGRDSREFAKDKPLTLIDGPNLVHLLEQHGYRVRLDVKAARAVG